MTGDTACSSLRMMLLMFSPSCGIRRASGRGAPTLINVSRLIFELENYPGLTGWDQSLDRSRGWTGPRSVYSTCCGLGLRSDMLSLTAVRRTIAGFAQSRED